MSTLTIELDNLTDSRLQERSLQEGRKKEELAAGLLASSLGVTPAPELSEAGLLEQINQGWNEQEWQRYHALVDLRKEERLTDAEYQELCDLTTAREVAHVNRLRFVVELAKLRNVTLEEAMQQLGLGSNTEPDANQLALIANLQQWNAEDATHDPEEIARREARWQVTEQNIATNRVSFPVPED